MGSKSRTTFEYTSTGQKRPYGDSFTEGFLTFEMTDWRGDTFTPRQVNEAQAKRAAQAFVSWYDEPTDPFQPVLNEFLSVGEGQWFVSVRSRYTD